ncbi:hypothetical protein GCM10022205_03030 [Spinactinospora alkalitolerans]
MEAAPDTGADPDAETAPGADPGTEDETTCSLTRYSLDKPKDRSTPPARAAVCIVRFRRLFALWKIGRIIPRWWP